MLKEIEMRAKAFAGEGVRDHRISVDDDGDVRVWDEVAGYYTTCHSLCKDAIRRARKIAMPWRVRLHPEGLIRRRFISESAAEEHARRLSCPNAHATVERDA